MRAIDGIMALISADIGIPIYYGAFQPTTAQQTPPDSYGVYTTMETPGAMYDDHADGIKAYAYLTLYGGGDVRDKPALVRQSACDHNAWAFDATDSYSERAGRYAVSMTIVQDGG